MIVRSVPGGVQVITQPDHAKLAARIMEHCVALAIAPRRDSILLAIAEHDNGWTEEDERPIVTEGTGAIADFINVPVAVRQAVWLRGVSRLVYDPWAAALVAQHAITVYDRFRVDPEWTSFFDRMQDTRDALVLSTPLSIDDLIADYRFVRLGDLISLTFCTGWTDAQRFADWTVQRRDDRVIVAPDPFDGTTIPVTITARVLPAVSFDSDAALRSAVRSAGTTTLRGMVSGAPA